MSTLAGGLTPPRTHPGTSPLAGTDLPAEPPVDPVAALGVPAIADVPAEPPVGTVGVGVIAPYDFALDRELWRWVPDTVTLHLTRTPYAPLPVSLEQAGVIGDPAVVTRCAADLMTVQPDVLAYACTSGSFVRGAAGEQELVAAMRATGAGSAVTTSGSLVRALRHVGAARVALATPYDAAISLGLRTYLESAGFTVTASRHLGLEGRIWTVPYAVTVDIVRRSLTPDCDAVFISCTNLPTFDIITPLEAELGVPVLTANQVTLWAALRAVGIDAVGAGQRLLTQAPLQAPDAGSGSAPALPPPHDLHGATA